MPYNCIMIENITNKYIHMHNKRQWGLEKRQFDLNLWFNLYINCKLHNFIYQENGQTHKDLML